MRKAWEWDKKAPPDWATDAPPAPAIVQYGAPGYWRRINGIVERLRELDVPESAIKPIERWRDENREKP